MTRRDDPLRSFLPSAQTKHLGAAIGRCLVEIDRLLVTTREDFVARGGADDEYFARASGPAQLRFDDGSIHVLSVWPSELSLLVKDQPLAPDWAAEVFALSTTSARAELRACLGRRCEDVRIWTVAEEVDWDAAREAAISYLLSGGVELFYAIYLHGDLDSDYLMLCEEVPRDKVARCWSI